MTKLDVKMHNLNDFEGKILHALRRCDPSIGWWDTGVGRLALVGQTTGSLFGTSTSKIVIKD